MRQSHASLVERLKTLLVGKARNIRDPSLFHSLSLVAFFAWVGLGADGLSSSSYGPEEAFLALGGHPYLGIFVALATALTVIIITASYSQIVELFPTGGGGYLVASRLLSSGLGMASGCALLIDYLLTITLSVASGTDAVFSFLPLSWQPYKIVFAMLGIFVLVALNLRGVRESVIPLVPIFMVFLLTHVFAILYAIGANILHFNELASATRTELGRASGELGIAGTLILILRSYSMGAGTYTGIEAVSNGLPILREPRVQTAKKTLRYMAASLAFTAAGLMVGYLLYRVAREPGKTLNAVLMERISSGWGAAGTVFAVATLLSEAVLLFVAAQAGFLDGPRVLSNMALDRWFPQQFALLSERLVIKNGILLMGAGAAVLMMASGGSVQFLVVLYAINVFITFSLSQAGMVRHWWRERKRLTAWPHKLFINGIGLLLSLFILVSQIVLKFTQGGWITLLVTGSLAAVAAFIHRFYTQTRKKLSRLDSFMEAAIGSAAEGHPRPIRKKKGKTAVILVSGFNGTGLHTLFSVRRVFGEMFTRFIFMQAGILDAGRFKGTDSLEELGRDVEQGLEHYVSFMRRQGFQAEAVRAMGTDVADEICTMAEKIFTSRPDSVFFSGQIVFAEETILSRLLFNHTAFAVQRRLHQVGIPFIIMPARVK